MYIYILLYIYVYKKFWLGDSKDCHQIDILHND